MTLDSITLARCISIYQDIVWRFLIFTHLTESRWFTDLSRLSIVSWTWRAWRTLRWALESSVNDYTGGLSKLLKGQSCLLRTNRKDAAPAETSVPLRSYSCCLLPDRVTVGMERSPVQSQDTHSSLHRLYYLFKTSPGNGVKGDLVHGDFPKRKESVICAKEF